MLTIEEAAARGRVLLIDALVYDADPDWWDAQARVAETPLAVRGRDGIARWDFVHRPRRLSVAGSTGPRA